MRIFALLLASLFALMPSAYSSERLMKVGDYKIDGIDDYDHFILDDGNVYKPLSHHQKDQTLDWQLGDNILVLKGRHTNQFLLINTRTNEKSKMKVTSMH